MNRYKILQKLISFALASSCLTGHTCAIGCNEITQHADFITDTKSIIFQAIPDQASYAERVCETENTTVKEAIHTVLDIMENTNAPCLLSTLAEAIKDLPIPDYVALLDIFRDGLEAQSWACRKSIYDHVWDGFVNKGGTVGMTDAQVSALHACWYTLGRLGCEIVSKTCKNRADFTVIPTFLEEVLHVDKEHSYQKYAALIEALDEYYQKTPEIETTVLQYSDNTALVLIASNIGTTCVFHDDALFDNGEYILHNVSSAGNENTFAAVLDIYALARAMNADSPFLLRNKIKGITEANVFDYAEDYVSEKIQLSATEQPSALPHRVAGDVDGDGALNLKDLTIILTIAQGSGKVANKSVNNLEKAMLYNDLLKNHSPEAIYADTNNDGRVDNKDLTRFSVNMDN